jgi:hypothetical protein
MPRNQFKLLVDVVVLVAAFLTFASGMFLFFDLSLAAIEVSLGSEFLRVHRQWLVHTAHVRAIENQDGETIVVVGDEPPRELRVPVARDRKAAVLDLLLHGASSKVGPDVDGRALADYLCF